MPYFTTVFIIVLVGLVTLKAWVKNWRLSKKNLDIIQLSISEKISLEQWDNAQQEIKPLLKKSKIDAFTYLLHAQILRGTQHLQESLSILDKAIETYPTHLPLYREKGKILLELGHHSAALQMMNQAKSILKSEEDAIDLASLLLNEEQIDEAWQILINYVSSSRQGRLFALAGDCRLYCKEYTQAIVFYIKARHCGCNNHRLLARLGYAFMQTGKIDEAKYCYQKILIHDSADVNATLGLGACLEIQGNFHQALAIYQNGKAWNFGDVRILRQAGLCAAHTKQYRFAELYLKESLTRSKSSLPESLAYLGYSLEKQKSWEEAEKIYFQLVKEHPTHIAGYRALAWLYGVGLSTQIDSSVGLAMAYQALQMLPDHTSWELLSACEARSGNYHKAHSIQEQLSSQSCDPPTRQRRRHAMRKLRQKLPLDETMVCQVLVA